MCNNICVISFIFKKRRRICWQAYDVKQLEILVRNIFIFRCLEYYKIYYIYLTYSCLINQIKINSNIHLIKVEVILVTFIIILIFKFFIVKFVMILTFSKIEHNKYSFTVQPRKVSVIKVIR